MIDCKTGKLGELEVRGTFFLGTTNHLLLVQVGHEPNCQPLV